MTSGCTLWDTDAKTMKGKMTGLNRFLAGCVAVFCMSVSGAWGQDIYYVTATSLNLRKTMSVDAPIVAVLRQYQEVLVHSKTGEWAEVSTDAGMGYVSAKYLAKGKAPQQVQPANQSTVLICVSSSAYAYHSYQCRGLSRCTHTITRVTIADAKGRGYRACQICY